jgi:hypothetical protein
MNLLISYVPHEFNASNYMCVQINFLHALLINSINNVNSTGLCKKETRTHNSHSINGLNRNNVTSHRMVVSLLNTKTVHGYQGTKHL